MISKAHILRKLNRIDRHLRAIHTVAQRMRDDAVTYDYEDTGVAEDIKIIRNYIQDKAE